MGTVFQKLGVYGLAEEKENALLASLFTGDPALLIGPQGTSKTGLIEALGSAFRERSKREANKNPGKETKIFEYHIYDASKMQFEDLVGFPNVAKMQEGKIEYISTPQSAWGKELVGFDEFNRQDPSRQNNIFEMIRSRRLMGLPTGTKWIINCMNHFGMAGTEQLDDALVDRHQWFIYIDRFTSMSSYDQELIVQHAGASDGIGIKHWTGEAGIWDTFDGKNQDGTWIVNDKLADCGDEITAIMTKAAVIYKTLTNEVSKGYTVFISKFWKQLSKAMDDKDWKIELSGRRAGMTLRALLAYRSVELAKCEVYPRLCPMATKDFFRVVFKMVLPIGVASSTSAGMDSNALNAVNANIDSFNEFFEEKNQEKAISSIEIIHELLTTSNINRKIYLLTHKVNDNIAKSQVWDEIIRTSGNIDTYEGLRNSITVSVIAHMMTINPKIVPVNMQALLVQNAHKTLSFDKIYNGIILGGQMAFYADEITKIIDSYDDILVKLQAKCLFEQQCAAHKSSTINRNTFKSIANSVIAECDSLVHMLKERSITDEAANSGDALILPI